MPDCCATKKTRKQACPNCGTLGNAVSNTTIIHHLKAPWQWQANDQKNYFCADTQCDVVYFNSADSSLKESDIRTLVGIKHISNPCALVCYCFNVSRKETLNNPEIKAYVAEKTKEKQCACEIRNPSGKCCLKVFP